jgi:hypothetical protein
MYCVITSPVPCVNNWRWNSFSPWFLLINLPKKFIWTILWVAVSLLEVCVCVCVGGAGGGGGAATKRYDLSDGRSPQDFRLS